jgi:Fic family protein
MIMTILETPDRIEPATIEETAPNILDVVAELALQATELSSALHPRTVSALANLVRIVNTHYSNLIEGHYIPPRDIERALSGDLDSDQKRHALQLEAIAHFEVQADVDRQYIEGTLPDPTSSAFIRFLHYELYCAAPESILLMKAEHREFRMQPGAWRSKPEHDVQVGQHLPPSSDRVSDFMHHFERRYRQVDLGKVSRVLAIPAAHHRLNYIHPFPDGNGRVSRLMSHAMAHTAGIGAHGLWSVSRGLALGLENSAEYKEMMDYADTPRMNDLDGRGNLSLRALKEFTLWFLRCVSIRSPSRQDCSRSRRWPSGSKNMSPKAKRLCPNPRDFSKRPYCEANSNAAKSHASRRCPNTAPTKF